MSAPARRLAELRVAAMLLTRLPVGRLAGHVPTLAAARWAYPLVGAGVGVVMWAVCAGAAELGLPPGISALLAVAAGVLATGGLHEDGLADLADGFGGGRDRARKLEIMRDSRIGSYGVLALAIVLGLKVQAMAGVAGSAPPLGPFVALAAGSRFAMLAVLEALPPARADGLGHAAGETGGWRPWAGLAVALAVMLPLGGAALGLLAALALAAVAVAVLAKRQIGGQTGDVLGAVQQVSDGAGWLAALLLLGGG
ncbi:adenosylcobinamide-GDP ribazoletransferase [Actibacterium sp. MT2.3-13A]|uniref:adenosylcobinamide-GDP ribazoletransferase n=1 Tax=Actibacterium sp. MT2.3-13A TaxID=2828332 RepID=UPI001BA502FF|nr:adenosylcobinamide-GDP ribazoletransferase [Actibacterium sp. MT2.3-13A]